MKKKNVLILTGWGWCDYAYAAALALKNLSGADVYGVSTRRLPILLDEVTDYSEIYILGIGLRGNPELLAAAVKKLDQQKVKVHWISALDCPAEIAGAVGNCLELFVDHDGLTEAVAQYFHYPERETASFLKKYNEDNLCVRHLLEAAMYFYRSYQDDQAYGSAIRHIAREEGPESWLQKERDMVDCYLRSSGRELLGESPEMQQLRNQIDRIAHKDHARVLILGKSGTGKETVAMMLHRKSPRSKEPFIAFNCASVTPNLLEDRFFGHEKGAFTGASERKIGLFELADGGTLFLDEIGELPLEAQGLLLRVLEGGRFCRLGGSEELSVNVRLLTATNRDLAAEVRKGVFRQDLFFRLNVISLCIPPLREHLSDIRQIADRCWLKYCHRHLSEKQISCLLNYDYPGNVRELLNMLEKASVLEDEDFSELVASQRKLMASLQGEKEEDGADELEAAIQLHVRKVYEKYDRNLSRAACALQVTRNTARKYLEMEKSKQ